MNNIIEVDIENKEDLVEKYNKDVVSRDLIKYIIDKSLKVDYDAKIEILINNKTKLDAKNLIQEGFKMEYKKLSNEKIRGNIIQVIYFFIGLFFLVMSRLLEETSIFDEIFLIGGWVFIWEVVELELFHDFKNGIRRKKLKQLMKSPITIK